MRLTTRDLEAGDVDACFSQLSNPRAYECHRAGLLECVPDVWRSLIVAGAMRGDVVVDLDQPPDSDVVGFGAGVFVTDAFVRDAGTSMPPFVRAQLIETVLQDRSPILSTREICSSEGGLNLFILDDMLSNPNLSPEELREVRNKGVVAGLARFRCFRLKSWLSEVYGAQTLQMVEMAGAAVRRDYNEILSHNSVALTPCERPYLVGMTREEALKRDGSMLSMLFMHTPRILAFRPVEKQVLRLALQGETDEELASSLSVSLSAIKKRWHGIYEHVERANPNVLREAASDVQTDGVRRSEKRRHLLNYLREHPEEIQPNVP